MVVETTRGKGTKETLDREDVDAVNGRNVSPLLGALANIDRHATGVCRWTGVWAESGILQGLMGGHEEKPLHWVHLHGLTRGHVE
jgi:hypothetical protein